MTIKTIEIVSVFTPLTKFNLVGIKILDDNYHVKHIETKYNQEGTCWINTITLDSIDKLNLIHKENIMEGVRKLAPDKEWEIFHYEKEDDNKNDND